MAYSKISYELGSWSEERRGDLATKIVLFFISPLLALIYSLRRLNTRSSYIVIFLFCCFFGLAFSVPSGKDASSFGYDGQVYRKKFEEFHEMEYFEFQQRFSEYISFDSGRKDFFFDVVAFYTSRITENYHLLFALLASVFAFFMLRTLRYFTQNENFDHSLITFLLLYLFTFNQIFNINGIRFWLAAWIAIYCVFKIFKEGHYRYVFLLTLTPFVHGSYWLAVIITAVALVLRKYERLWVLLFLASFGVSYFASDFLNSIQNLLPYYLSRSIDVYTNSDYIELRNSWDGVGIFRVLFEDGRYIFINVMVALFIFHSRKNKLNIASRDLYLFTLIWMTVVNFTMSIPSLGGRYIIVLYPVVSYLWLDNFKGRSYSMLIIFLPFAFAYQIYSQAIKYSNVLDIQFIFSSPFYLIYKNVLNV